MQAIPVDLQIEGRPDLVRVVVDQRDFARAEAEDLYDDTPRKHTRTRFLAWSAAKRAEVTTKSWAEFNASDLISAEVAPEHYEQEAGDPPADGLDPGRTDQNANA